MALSLFSYFLRFLCRLFVQLPFCLIFLLFGVLLLFFFLVLLAFVSHCAPPLSVVLKLHP